MKRHRFNYVDRFLKFFLGIFQHIHVANEIMLHLFSSLSQYVHTVDALNLPEDERKFVDAQIDTIYEDIEKGMDEDFNSNP